VVNTAFLNATSTQVGDKFTVTGHGRSVTLTITGEVFDPGGTEVFTNLSPVVALDPSGLSPQQYDVGLRPGVNAPGYENAVFAKLGPGYSRQRTGNEALLDIISGLVIILALLLVAVAGLGVTNTVVLTMRERVHDLGVFKAVGVTPRQVIAMVLTTVAATGLIAGLIAVPAGTALQRAILPVMGNAAQTGLPAGGLQRLQPGGAGAASTGRPGHRGGRRPRPGRLGGAGAHGARAARGVTRAPLFAGSPWHRGGRRPQRQPLPAHPGPTCPRWQAARPGRQDAGPGTGHRPGRGRR
jgi:hypothetical protein